MSAVAMRRRLLLLGLAVLTALAVAGGVWWLRRDAVVLPPVVDLSGADPEVARLVESARREVLAEPRSAERWGHLGMVLRAHDFADESGECFTQAERFDPAEPRWPYYRGLTLVLTQPRKGLSCLRRAIDRLGDGPPAPRFRLVEVLLEQGELDEAADQLRRALSIAPGHLRGRLLGARLALARRDWKRALGELEDCWDDVHTQRQARHLAAEAWQRLGDSARAEKLLAEARGLPPDVPWADPLVEEVERLVVGVRARLALASRLEHTGQPGEAIRVLELLLEDQPREVSAWVMLGQLLRRQRQFGPAEDALKRAVEIDPGSVEGWFHLGVVRALGGRKREAVDAFRAAVRLKPDHALAHYNLGLCLQDTGDRGGARRAFEAALLCQPDHAAARRALAALGGPGGK
jgi:tetratricopeptide (TPR) repeat protein